MPYSKFTSLVKFCRQYNLRLQDGQRLFEGIILPPFVTSERLLQDLEEAQAMPIATEKAKSEWLISPILKELKRQNPFISVFSGFSLNIEGEPDLQGNPDYILTARPSMVEIIAPIFCIMESKNKTPDEGYAQCAAEMYAARLFNEQTQETYETIYGAVTNGFEWIFLKLEGDHLFVDQQRYFLVQLPQLLSVLQYIIAQYK